MGTAIWRNAEANEIERNTNVSTINLNKPLPELNAKDLPALIKLYLDDCQPRVAAGTFKDYNFALHNYLLAWWLEVGPAQNWILRRNDFIAFLSWMEARPSRQGERLGATTIDSTFKRIKGMFAWAHKNDYLDRDYGVWLPSVNVQPAPRNLPQPVELNRLFRVAAESEKAARNKAVLAVLIGTGVRRQECVDIDVTDITWNKDDAGGKIDIRCGKNGKRRTVLFDEKTGRHLKLYLQVTKFKVGPLFRGRYGRLGAAAVNVMIKALTEKAGLTDKIKGPHDLRRMFATEWLRKNHSEGAIQPLSLQLGHSDPQMTLHYSKTNLDDVKKNFRSPMSAVEE